jgi:hypothetical protein
VSGHGTRTPQRRYVFVDPVGVPVVLPGGGYSRIEAGEVFSKSRLRVSATERARTLKSVRASRLGQRSLLDDRQLQDQEMTMSLGTILLIILILILVGALPTWPYSSSWGYYPSGGIGLVLVILLILVLMGRL